jgi:REP element-mobilizing transposase RayT
MFARTPNGVRIRVVPICATEPGRPNGLPMPHLLQMREAAPIPNQPVGLEGSVARGGAQRHPGATRRITRRITRRMMHSARSSRTPLGVRAKSIINDQGHKTLAIGGVENHIHLFFGFRPTQSLSSLMLRVKRETSEWINKEILTDSRFQWQNGYGAFSYSKSHVPNVIRYILNQEAHHANRSFREEYLDILRKNEVEFDEQYIFEDI